MDSLEHLLSKHKILISFTIGKKISEETIQKLTDKIKKVSKNKYDFDSKLKEEIKQDTMRSIVNGTIPGIILDPQLLSPVNVNTDSQGDKVKYLYVTDQSKIDNIKSMYKGFVDETVNGNLNKNDICFIMFLILNQFKITDKDFKSFIETLKKSENNEDDGDFLDL